MMRSDTFSALFSALLAVVDSRNPIPPTPFASAEAVMSSHSPPNRCLCMLSW